MKQQEKEIIEQLTIEETGDQDLYQLADLGLSDQQLDEVKGGPGGWGCTTCDIQNHNETTVSDDEVQIDDLPVVGEQADEIRGGPGGGWGCSTCDYSNHNETTVTDKDDEANLADLSLTDEELDGIKGGKTVKIAFCKTDWAH